MFDLPELVAKLRVMFVFTNPRRKLAVTVQCTAEERACPVGIAELVRAIEIGRDEGQVGAWGLRCLPTCP